MKTQSHIIFKEQNPILTRFRDENIYTMNTSIIQSSTASEKKEMNYEIGSIGHGSGSAGSYSLGCDVLNCMFASFVCKLVIHWVENMHDAEDSV